MSQRTIFLVGAPLPSSLDWDHDELLNTPIPPFCDANNSTAYDPAYEPCLDQKVIKWRALQPLSSDTQLINADSASSDEDDSALSQFYDHSFAVHETSQINASGLREENPTQSSSGLDDLMITDTSDKDVSESPPIQIRGPLKDLGDIPTAKYLQSIVPQTMTVNLVVGIIAIHPPRRVVTRQWKKELDIIELVVGDETRAGFGVNFWLPAPTDRPGAKAREIDWLASSLASLRPQDIVLLRTVGLGSFRDQVYGQSLRGGMTQVDLLYRPTDAGRSSKVIPPSHGIDDDLPQKVRKVREWILRFVGTDEVGGSPRGMLETQRGHRQLPPDTQ
ncbi:uncharacterized protein N7483_004579 [Penicillium malachiteum]|uniref:uncharacterized protein n=1 Tax=Penicillium malachiteum TaxID=1324776 RepID=UPI0025465984|nr:uncharacterized protein N7483_004579 [Penicillium malachiteum]KAJ5730071.1 hypothetical protein N7483_004579 [Penicillium malachiteum]